MDDALLNARAANGDRKAFALLVARHEARLRGFLRRIASPSDADDLAQDTFVRAWERAAQFQAGGSYAAWLTQIGWRLFLDERRRVTSRAKRDVTATEQLANTQAHGGDLGLDLAAALERLDPQARAAIALCDGQGWTHEEAAAMLDLPLGTLKSLISRGKAKLRAFLTTGG
ncbi:RNA polymerase sigma factor [Caulobacter sp. 602-1]|uniref:RNA polymerase sigma factor n=1 Tax=unclassified Caulobacter TaxID=2648921 RepID=UPI0013152E62|nr:RNA polymerase sigma factor [Caulobacter sp. 602-1]